MGNCEQTSKTLILRPILQGYRPNAELQKLKNPFKEGPKTTTFYQSPLKVLCSTFVLFNRSWSDTAREPQCTDEVKDL